MRLLPLCGGAVILVPAFVRCGSYPRAIEQCSAWARLALSCDAGVEDSRPLPPAIGLVPAFVRCAALTHVRLSSVVLELVSH